MSNIDQLLESANPWQSQQSDAARLAKKWDKTGLLEGLENETDKNNMSVILENQAKQLVVESSLTGGGVAGGTFTAGVGGQWAGVALPLVRKIFGQIASKDFVSVQPMNLPSGLVFYLEFQYGTNKVPFDQGQSLYGNSGSAYNPFGNDAAGGLYGAGRYQYSINQTSSNALTVTSSATWSDLDFDSTYSASAVANEWLKVDISGSQLSYKDTKGVRAFRISGSALLGGDALSTGENFPQWTKYNEASDVITFIISASDAGTIGSAAGADVYYQLQPTDNRRGDFEDGNTTLNGDNNPISIPEINVQMRSSAIVAKTRKLKAVWTPEFAQDLNAYHSLDAEAELTSIMSEYVSLEIDLEILDMIMQVAPLSDVWSANNNEAFTSTTGDGTTTDLGFYNSQGQWFQTLGTKLQKLSNQIHQRTLRGGANFLVCSPTVATIIESIPGFASNSDGDAAKMQYAFGVQKAGQLNSRYNVYKNPYMLENRILLGFRGSQFLESGAVFAPYIPLIMTPLVYDPSTFTPRKGLLTRYAKKVVRPEFYATLDISGLNTL